MERVGKGQLLFLEVPLCPLAWLCSLASHCPPPHQLQERASLGQPVSCLFWGGGRGVVPISAVMRLIKSLASWPGWAEQGPKSWRKRDLRLSNSSLFYRSYKNGNLQSSLGVAPLDARGSETMDVKRLAQFLAHGRHLINGVSITIIIAPVSSGRGTRRPGRVPQLVSGPGSFLAGGLSYAG